MFALAALLSTLAVGASPAQVTGVVFAKGTTVAGAVVLLEGRGSNAPPTRASLSYEWPTFTPKIQVVPVGSTLVVHNDEDALHTALGRSGDRILFHLAEPQGARRTVRLLSEGVIAIRCAVHRWMRAHVVVAATPHYAITDKQGRFSISGVPSGRFRVRVWRPGLPSSVGQVGAALREISVAGGHQALRLEAPTPPPIQ